VREPVGIGGVVAALSVTSDLTRGHPAGEAMRACLLATELARRAVLGEAPRGDVYYAALMRFAGCAATSHELAGRLGGDDVVVRARGDLIDASRPMEALRLLAGLGEGVGKLQMLGRARGAATFFAEGARADCEVGADLTRRLRLPEAVSRAVLDGFERFDGRGAPEGRAGTDVAEPARFAAVAYAAVMFDAVGGGVVAAETVGRWSGRALDRRSPRSSRTRPRSCCGSRTRTTSGLPSSMPSRHRGGRSATTRPSTTHWPASVTPPT
jgi:hypothetical protein